MYHVCAIINTENQRQHLSAILTTDWIETLVYDQNRDHRDDIHKKIIKQAMQKNYPYVIIYHSSKLQKNISLSSVASSFFDDNFERVMDFLIDTLNQWDVFNICPIIEIQKDVDEKEGNEKGEKESGEKDEVSVVYPYPLIVKYTHLDNMSNSNFVIYNQSCYSHFLSGTGNKIEEHKILKKLTCVDYLLHDLTDDVGMKKSNDYLKCLAFANGYVSTTLLGRLGNQVFQLSIGFAYAYKHKLPLIYDHTQLPTKKKNSRITHWKDMFQFMHSAYNPQMVSEIFPNSVGDKENIIEKQCYIYQNIVRENPKSCIMLSGFWQHIKYIENYQKQLRSFFRSNDQKLQYLYKKYPWLNDDKVCKIMLHFRRTDYNNEVFFPLPKIYYDKCLQLIEKELVDKTIYNKKMIIAFSDDIKLIRRQFPNYDYYVSREADYLEIYMMTHADYLVIANSTFSWCGAFLIRKENAVIYVPHKWTHLPSDSMSLPHWKLIKF